MATDSCRSAYLASLSFLVVMLSACKMGPDYHRPETPKADAWRWPEFDGGIDCEFALVGTFQGQELQELIRIALAENLDVRTAVATVEQYRAQLVMTQVRLGPSLGL